MNQLPDDLKRLKKIAPSISFSVDYTEDPNYVWDGDGDDPAEDGYAAYDVDVSARSIVNGDDRIGHAYLGGSYWIPDKFDPDIGGYLPQMLDEALDEMTEDGSLSNEIRDQVNDAHSFIKDVMTTRWKKQQR